MNKVTGDLIRNVLKIGGATLATSGLLPAQCHVADPNLSSSAGAIMTIVGIVWGLVSAQHHQMLKEETS